MKKTLLILMGFCFAILNIQADEQKKVTLDSNHDKETVSLPYCNFFVSLADKDDNSTQVKIELENLDETNVLILFDRAYDEKTIKQMPTSIRFDKTFGGSKNKRVIDPYEGNARQVMLFRPSDKFELPLLTVNNGEPLNCRLPIYIAKSKGKKLLLLEKQVIELSIEVEMKPSAEYVGLKDKTDRLARELSNAVICTNPKHKTSAAKQRDAYEKRINSLKEDIDDAIKSHNWQPDSRGYMRYNELKKQLDDIDLSSKEGDCGRHRARKGGGGSGGGHSCSYCSLSLQQIYHKLDDLYKKIYSSSDRKAAKASVISQVNALYTCASTSSCSKHASEWKNSSYRSKITERYNRISGM